MPVSHLRLGRAPLLGVKLGLFVHRVQTSKARSKTQKATRDPKGLDGPNTPMASTRFSTGGVFRLWRVSGFSRRHASPLCQSRSRSAIRQKRFYFRADFTQG